MISGRAHLNNGFNYLKGFRIWNWMFSNNAYHMHGIINLTDVVGAGASPAQNNAIGNDDNLILGNIWAGASPAPTIGNIIGAYKSLVAKDCLEILKQKKPGEIMGKLWQRNYHEHIIRNEKYYQRISEYIINNPARWSDDKFYTG
jgi:putative transposase